MTVCKYYLRGNCKFGDNCRFEHPNQYNHNENRYKYRSGNTSHVDYEYESSIGYNQRVSQPKVGFSFNKTLHNLPNNDRLISRTITQQTTHQKNDIKRTVFQTPKPFNNSNIIQNNLYSVKNNSPSVEFSFSRTLNTIQNQNVNQNVKPSQHLTSDDIDMESSQNKQQFNQLLISANSNRKIVKQTETQSTANNNDIYSKANDLTEKQIKCYESNEFTYRNIPIQAPPQQLCH